ncbi:MAG: PTS sugar transporter subunit IIA [Gammaproteobacteria bacterium]|nr:PTS sugar transporter subunit IIA [Gammaproteobacteria bacterium]
MEKEILSSLSLVNKKVLIALIEKEKPVSTQYLADELSLSISQVRYSIKKLQALLKFKDIFISQKQNEGVMIEVCGKNRDTLLSELNEITQEINALTPQERINLLLQLVLTQSSGNSYNQLRESTGITSTSFYRDILGVQEWLETRQLDLQIKRNAPLKIIGEESIIREAIQEICMENLGQDFFVQACVFPYEMIEIGDYSKKVFYEKIMPFLQSVDLLACEKEVRRIEKNFKTKFLDTIHLELSLKIGIAVQRINQGYLLPAANSGKSGEISYYREAYQILKKLVDDFEEQHLLGETIHLANVIGNSFQKSVFDYKKTLPQTRAYDWEKTAISIVTEIGKYFHAGLCKDIELINCIKWELAFFASSSQPQTLDKKESYDSEKKLSIRKIISNIVVPILCDEGYEIGVELYTSIENHVLAALEKIRRSTVQRRVLLVCGSGFATAVTLQRQLMNRLPEIEIIGVVSAFELAHKTTLLEDCDAVISTIPLGRITSVPQYIVRALLTNEDIDMIRKMLDLQINDTNEKLFKENSTLSLMDIISVKTIKNSIFIDSPEEVIGETGALLLSVDAIWPSYIRAMKNMYKMYGPYMIIAPNTAFFHAGPEMGAKKAGISLITLSQPVVFGHIDFDPVKIAMAFSIPNHTNQVSVLSDIFNFFAQESNREKIYQSKSPQETLQIFLSNLKY